MHRSGVLMIGGALAILIGCSPAIDRPLRGALPGSPVVTPPGVPPTLQAADALRGAVPSPSSAADPSSPAGASSSPSPGAGASASPVASPSAGPAPSVVAAPPIVRTIVPAANGTVPPGGALTVSAVLIGRGADLASASLALDGADTGAQIDKRSSREWSIHVSQGLPAGTHTARVLVRDAAGANGGFTWRFTVGAPQQAASPEPSP